MTDSYEEASPVFVDGIGPPLRQIREDYIGERTTEARDIVALIDAYLDLSAREERLRLMADSWHAEWKESRKREERLREALQRFEGIDGEAADMRDNYWPESTGGHPDRTLITGEGIEIPEPR